MGKHVQNLNISNDIRQAAIDYYAESIYGKTAFEKISIWSQQLKNLKIRYLADKSQYEASSSNIKYFNIPYASEPTDEWINYRNSKINEKEITNRQAFLETFLEGYYLIQYIRDNIIGELLGMVYTLGFSVQEEGKETKLKEKTVSLQDFFKGVNLDKAGNALQISLGSQLKDAFQIARRYKSLKVSAPAQAGQHYTLFGQVFALFNDENPLGIWAFERGLTTDVKKYTNKGRAFQVYRRIVAIRRRNKAISDFETLADIAIDVFKDTLESITGGDWLQEQLKYFGQGSGKASLISEKELFRVIEEYENIFIQINQNSSSPQKIKQALSSLINQQINENSVYAEKVLINKIDKEIDNFIKEVSNTKK